MNSRMKSPISWLLALLLVFNLNAPLLAQEEPAPEVIDATLQGLSGTPDEKLQTIVTLLATIFARVTGLSLDEARARYEGQCQMLVMLVKAMAMRTAQCGPASPALAVQVHAVIDRILAEVSNAKAEG